MNRKKVPLFLVLAAGILFCAGCSRSISQRQLRFGLWAAQKDLWDEALFRWKKAIEISPGSAAAHNNLAVAYEKKALWENAEREYEEALKIEPGNTYAKSNYDRFKANRKAVLESRDRESKKDDAEKKEPR
jgi:Tfp pilus assembly protein PilF